jgi:hypothetical protein
MDCPGRNRDSLNQSIFIVWLLPDKLLICTGKAKPEEVIFEIGLSIGAVRLNWCKRIQGNSPMPLALIFFKGLHRQVIDQKFPPNELMQAPFGDPVLAGPPFSC